jgi:hypothetical protein
MNEKEYRLNFDPRILELLGPSLYTNIYYILAELIANADAANAKNVYIVANKDNITVEDDGTGMSYENGDIGKYLNVAAVSRASEGESLTPVLKRKKMGRKGVGKLAALSVSENVLVKTIRNGDKSSFILSRRINENNLLTPLKDDEITFEKIHDHGTSVVMCNPQYRLHATASAIKRNVLKLFPFIGADFQVHVIRGREIIAISDFDKEVVGELSALIAIGDEFHYLANHFNNPYESKIHSLCEQRTTQAFPLTLKDIHGDEHEYILEINGWIGTYKSTRGRKVEITDFPDNFISLYANKKMGEFNILPVVGQNKLPEVFVIVTPGIVPSNISPGSTTNLVFSLGLKVEIALVTNDLLCVPYPTTTTSFNSFWSSTSVI